MIRGIVRYQAMAGAGGGKGAPIQWFSYENHRAEVSCDKTYGARNFLPLTGFALAKKARET